MTNRKLFEFYTACALAATIGGQAFGIAGAIGGFIACAAIQTIYKEHIQRH